MRISGKVIYVIKPRWCPDLFDSNSKQYFICEFTEHHSIWYMRDALIYGDIWNIYMFYKWDQRAFTQTSLLIAELTLQHCICSVWSTLLNGDIQNVYIFNKWTQRAVTQKTLFMLPYLPRNYWLTDAMIRYILPNTLNTLLLGEVWCTVENISDYLYQLNFQNEY